jgi:hypothetical protein
MRSRATVGHSLLRQIKATGQLRRTNRCHEMYGHGQSVEENLSYAKYRRTGHFSIMNCAFVGATCLCILAWDGTPNIVHGQLDDREYLTPRFAAMHPNEPLSGRCASHWPILTFVSE